MDVVLSEGLAGVADGNEHGKQGLLAASPVIFLQIPCVGFDLVDVGLLGGDSILEFDDKNGAVLKDNQIGPSPSASGAFEFQNKGEAGGIAHTVG